MTSCTFATTESASAALRRLDLRQALYDEGAVLMEKVLVNLHGEEHRARRTVEARVLRKDFFDQYERETFPQTLAETIAPYLAAGKGDLVDFGYRVLMNLTCDFTGVDRPARTAEETTTLLRLLRTFGLAATLGQVKDPSVKEATKAQVKAGLDEFDALFFTPSVERRVALIGQMRAGALSEAELPRDVLTHLLLAEEQLDLPRYDMLREAAFFALAGAHTSIHSLSHAFHEITQWIAAHPEDAPRVPADRLFVQRCVHESLRLHPSSPVAKRRPTCPIHLDGQDLSEADEVVIDLRTANRETALFGEDADRFNPHRATPKGQQPYGLSMGLGMHACLGRNVAIGVLPKADTDPDEHQYGTVPLIVEALFRHGARPDPEQPARKDETITRITWASYPVLFDRP
jgi:cytochrome P450